MLKRTGTHIRTLINQGIPFTKGSNVLPRNSGTRTLMFQRDACEGFDAPGSSYTEKLDIKFPEQEERIPVYRVMDRDGTIVDGALDPKLDKDTVLKMYRDMTLLNTMDQILDESHNQGQISIYVTHYGEEAAHIGSAAALNKRDLIFGQHRDAGSLLYRGYPIERFVNQCLGNVDDEQRGRNMPVHYGSADHCFVTISSPLGTQMPQATGVAYAYKRKQNGLCVMCYLGEGTTGTADSHAGFNFASTLDCPVIFFCRNNGYAIATPTCDQYRGDGVASHGSGYGMATIRVDGNDVFAVYNATKAAREISVAQNRPVLIEAMTYRIGNHSTSFESSSYRSDAEVKHWQKYNNPITRFHRYLLHQGWWSEDQEEAWMQTARTKVTDALQSGLKKKKPNPEYMFTDVYKELPQHLDNQMKYMKQHVKKYKDYYPVNDFEAIESTHAPHVPN